MLYSKPLADLIAEFEKLPGIGPKSAQRLAYHVLRRPASEAERFALVLKAAVETLRFCSSCHNFCEGEICEICSDSKRDKASICVVAEPKDISAIERVNEYRGTYHVLHGVLSPMDDVGPDQIRAKELIARLESGVSEVILAMNATVEGDATALYLARLIKPLGVKVTRIAHGMPIGGELDYADSATLLSAFEYRREM
ncbi:MAG: recombination protein RecR [Armatimonadetes bacterium]|nr:recombination protein RecR [Armatimonadota bacterium]NOG38325.1 recombination protein RecR [Armatimonadota bacterium]GIK32503.1 MAG: recombination protein RecR [Armatimonadota bacterium]